MKGELQRLNDVPQVILIDLNIKGAYLVFQHNTAGTAKLIINTLFKEVRSRRGIPVSC